MRYPFRYRLLMNLSRPKVGVVAPWMPNGTQPPSSGFRLDYHQPNFETLGNVSANVLP